MYAVGKLGSYITQGVYTVSGPFHPFGGAVDIIVVEQQDGTFKSSPWYVRFGKFQGVLKSKEKVVDISVDGVQSDFHMYLDHRGQAYFLREVECEEGDPLLSLSSSGEDTDVSVSNRKPLKSKSCNYDSIAEIDIVNGKTLNRTGSRRSRIFGLVFGKKSLKENSFREEEDESGVVRADSLERAEIAADLLEVKWSTNLAFGKKKSNIFSKLSPSDTLVNEDNTDLLVNGEKSEEIGIGHDETDTIARLSMKTMGSNVEMYCLSNDVEEEKCDLDSQMVKEIDELVLMNANYDENVKIFTSETISPVLDSFGLSAHLNMDTVEESDCKEEIGVIKDTGGREPISEVKSVHENSLLLVKDPFDYSECLVNSNHEKIIIDSNLLHATYSKSFANSTVAETYRETINVGLENTSVNLLESCDTLTPKTVNIFSAEGVIILNSEISEEEQLLFGDFDGVNYHEDNCTKSFSSTPIVEDNNPSVIEQNVEDAVRDKPRVVSSIINIPERNKPGAGGIVRMAESLPNMWPPINEVVLNELQHPPSHSLHSNVEALKQIAPKDDFSSCTKPNTGRDDEISQSNVGDSQTIEDINSIPASIPVGDPLKAIDPSIGGWRVWPFSFRKSKSMNNTEEIQESTKRLDFETTLDSSIGTNKDLEVLIPKMKRKKIVRVLTPTPEQLASLNLKYGKNSVTFTFSTSMLGPQKVDARIFLWKWDARVVISDVDGTITKSDVLGQVMPMVGMDWSQIGVAHLFSAIEGNGYQLLFLSARAISQAHNTRQFLFNLKQDGKALPDGPVVISPDGLFPSLFREVIRRAPHEFKIACLEDIKALFPSDRSPFYAGFGNRITDEISYLRVGIPKGKTFIINPKGEVVANRGVHGKSYTSLKALVHDMFPPKSSSEQEAFNSWNFWKIPPRDIDI